MIIIPEWATPYFSTFEDDERAQNNTYKLSKEELESFWYFFARKRALVKKKCKEIDYCTSLPISELEILIRDYILCNTALAFIYLDEGRRSGDPTRNIGEGSQHWIPECYLKAFSKQIGRNNFKVQKVLKREDIKVNQAGNKVPLQNLPVRIDRTEFREGNANKGKFYSPEFEILLSFFEKDYGRIRDSIKLSHGMPQNLWEFVVLATFFVILSWRTKEQVQLQHSDEELEQGLLYDLTPVLIGELPKLVASYELRLIHRTIALYEDNQVIFYMNNQKPMRFPFNQNPFFRESDKNKTYSIWSIYNPDYLLWLKPKDSQHNSDTHKTSEFYSPRVSKVIENNDFRDLYFHPDDGIWNVIIKHTDDTCNNGPGRSIDLSHTTGNGSFKKLKTYSSLTENFETSTKYFANCSVTTPTILNLGNLTISFRSLMIKHDSKLLSKTYRLPHCNVREITAKRETEIIRVVGPLTNIPFYLNYDGSQKPNYSNPEMFRTVIELVNGINGTP